jgi:hypothetical protein
MLLLAVASLLPAAERHLRLNIRATCAPLLLLPCDRDQATAACVSPLLPRPIEHRVDLSVDPEEATSQAQTAKRRSFPGLSWAVKDSNLQP